MSGLLTFLLDRDDLMCLEAQCPQALEGTVVAFDPDLHIHLLSRGRKHLTPWSVVHKHDLDTVRDSEQSVLSFWNAHAHVEFAGLDLLQMVRFRHLSCFSRLAWAAFVVERVLAAVQPAEVVVFDETTGHGLEQPPEHNKMPLLQPLIRGAAEQRGLSVRVLRRGVPDGGGFVDWAAKRSGVQLPPVEPGSLLGDQPYVLFAGSGVDAIRPLPLVRELYEGGEVAVAQVYKSADSATLRRLASVGHFVWHESQLVGSVGCPAAPACAADGRRRFDVARRRAPAQLRSIFANPYLNIHFDFIFGDYAAKMAWNVRAWQRFFEHYPPAMLVSTSSSPINDVAHAAGIPCLGLPHGATMIGNTRWFACDRSSLIGAISETHRERLVEAGIEADRVVVTGDPALDWREERSAAASAPQAERADSRRQWGIKPTQHTVLLVMGNMGMLAKLGNLPLYDWAESVRSFLALGDLAQRHPDWRFVVRPHPRYDHPELYELVNRGLRPDQRLVVLDDEPLDKVMPGVDVVVVCNIVTSALLECSLWSKPVLVLEQSMIWYDSRAWGTESWLHLPSVEALGRELSAMFGDLTRYEQRLRQTETAADHYFAGVDQTAVSRCVDLIYESLGRPINT